MSLTLAIWNLQKKTSKNGKPYNGYTCVFEPGQHGRLSDADQLPPFYVRNQKGSKFGKEWQRLDAQTIEQAKAEALTVQNEWIAIAGGVAVVTTPDDEKVRLASRVTAFLAETEANKRHGTWMAYSRSMELFQESCKRMNVQDVQREDILAFKKHLAKTDSLGERAQYNYLLNVSVFFKWAGRTFKEMGFNGGDWLEKPERKPEAYTSKQIEVLLNAAAKTYKGLDRDKDEKRDDRLLLNAFLNSGMRDGEIMHLTYGDIDAEHSLWRVEAKPKWGWKPKTSESTREVPVAQWLTDKVMDRKKLEGKADEDLIFPNDEGRPDGHLIRILKRVATRAKVTGRVDQHKFRATCITQWLRDGVTVPDVMQYVGHVNPETILRYAASAMLKDKDTHNRITRSFNKYETMGD